MGNEALLSNLDHLRQENKLLEYVEQYYFFLATAVQRKDAKLVHTLLNDYTREVLYLDNRVRLYQLLQGATAFMSLPEYKQYQPLFYFLKGCVLHFAGEPEKAKKAYRHAVSIATEMKNFQVLATVLNNLIAEFNHFEPTDKKNISLMPTIIMGMMNIQQYRKQYMLLIVPIESALDLQQFDYAQRLLDATKVVVMKDNIILRERCQLDLVQLRIYLKSKQYATFFEKLDELESTGFEHQYDLQQVMYMYAIEAAKGIQDERLVRQYEAELDKCKELQKQEMAHMHQYAVKPTHLLRYMISFDMLMKKANRHIERGALPQYTLVLFHVERQHMTDEELQALQLAMHEQLLPNLKPVLFGCTIVSSSKLLYIFKQTEEQTIDYLRANVKPVIDAYRQKIQKSFRVIISYVQNDLYPYETFDQVLQYAYALVYYERYNEKEALLNA